MKYSKIAISAVIILILCVLTIAFFCILAFSSSYGYSKNQANALPSGSYSTDKSITVIIDPGHGGEDPGAIANGTIEKGINLSVAQKLNDFLSLSGVEVVMTRKDDALLGSGDKIGSKKKEDLNTRLKLLEDTENAILVSIHMNKFETASAHGLQTFYSVNNKESELLAISIQNASKFLDSTNNRDIKPATESIYLLDNAYKPAVLVECGFLSNKTDAQNLSNDDYQTKLAYTLYLGIVNYLGETK